MSNINFMHVLIMKRVLFQSDFQEVFRKFLKTFIDNILKVKNYNSKNLNVIHSGTVALAKAFKKLTG